MRGLAALSVLAILSGCSTSGTSGGSGGSFGGLFGSHSAETAPAAQAQGQVVPAPEGAVVQGFCPQVGLKDGTAFYRTYAKPGSKDPQDVVFQASLADSTRACTRSATSISVKIQVQGRLVAGPAGHAGSLSAPVRVSVVDGDRVVSSELVPFTVTLQSADQPSQFIFERELTVPGNLSPQAIVTVGFDESPAKAAKPAKTVKKHTK